MREQIFKEFAKKWGLCPENVSYIYWLAEESGRKYGKTSKILKRQNILISARQIKYFVKKVQLIDRLGEKRPANYSQMLRNETG